MHLMWNQIFRKVSKLIFYSNRSFSIFIYKDKCLCGCVPVLIIYSQNVSDKHNTGCPKKKVEIVGWAREISRPIFFNSGNFKSFMHKNFNILPKNVWEIKAQKCLP